MVSVISSEPVPALECERAVPEPMLDLVIARREEQVPGIVVLDLVDPDEEFTVSQFQQAAQRALEAIAARGHHALLVGGTGL